MKCIQCQTELNDNENYCPKCGLPIYRIEKQNLELVCQNCNNKLDINDKYCNKCGKKIEKKIFKKIEDIPDKKGNAFAIIAIICLIISVLLFINGGPLEDTTYIFFIIGILAIITGKMKHPKNTTTKAVSNIFIIIIILAIIFIILIIKECVTYGYDMIEMMQSCG